MTVIVWDGYALATDCAATDGATQWETTKAWYHNGEVLSGVGALKNILLMREWYKSGADPAAFPHTQQLPQWCHFLVVREDGLWRYEQTHIPIAHGRVPCAFGEGRDFAFGALDMGATAEIAVNITNRHSPHCGLGVKLYVYGGNDG